MAKIDLVIPMVFPADPEWRKEYDRCHGNGQRVQTHVRYRTWGTEELLVTCVMKYMPWVNCIHVLLARESQKQEWMDALSRYNGITELRLVYHKDFIPKEYLPCYASPCIEMFLHRIPGLSEQFIYANDDMFPLSPLSPEDFFRPTPQPLPIMEGSNYQQPAEVSTPSHTGEGREGVFLPCFHYELEPYPCGPNIFQRKCMNQQNMIGKEFGRHYTNKWLRNGHGFAPILKSTCEVVWWRHGEEIRKHLSPLRRTDHSYNHYIYLLYQYFSGRMVDKKLKTQLINGDTPAKNLASIVRNPDAGIVCFNDNENINDWKVRAAIVREAISEKLKMNNEE